MACFSLLVGFFCLTQPTEEQILDYYYYDKAVTLNIIMAHLFLVGSPEIVPNKLHNGAISLSEMMN